LFSLFASPLNKHPDNHLNIVVHFIDGQNLNLAIQHLGWKLGFRKFRVYLSEKQQEGDFGSLTANSDVALP